MTTATNRRGATATNRRGVAAPNRAAVATTVAPAAARRSGWSHWGTLAVMLASSFMITLDFFIVNVAIPSIQSDLHTNAAAIQWIIAGYGLAYGAGLITWGRMGDLYGRRRMFALGIGLFTVASAACGLAPTAGALVAARLVQGLSAAMMAPQGLAIIGLVYTGVDRDRAFNANGLAMGLAAVFGQLIGGLLIQADATGLGWRLCFLINVPIGIAAAVLTPRVVPESRATDRVGRVGAGPAGMGPAGRASLDLTGAALVAAGLAAAVLPLIQGRQQGWPLWSVLCLVGAAPLLGAFVAYQRRLTARGGSPLINTSLFRDRRYSIGVAATLLYYISMSAFFLVVALYLQQGRQLSALDSGLVLTAMGVGFFASSMAEPRLVHRLGRQVIALGALLLVVGWVTLGVTVVHIGVAGPAALLIPGLFSCGLGMGMIMAPLASTALAGVPSQHAGAASGALSTAIQIGSALGVALIGLIFYGGFRGAGGPDLLANAFTLSLIYLIGLVLTIAAMVQLLPRDRAH